VGMFRKKPVVIEAIQFTGINSVLQMEESWGVPFIDVATFEIDENNLIIKTLEGDHNASFNDWIIKGIKGEFYPCKPDIFEATYEPAG
jgi:hypothetical protein